MIKFIKLFLCLIIIQFFYTGCSGTQHVQQQTNIRYIIPSDNYNQKFSTKIEPSKNQQAGEQLIKILAVPELKLDGRLDNLAGGLADEIKTGRPRYDVIQFYRQWYGLIENDPLVITVTSNDLNGAIDLLAKSLSKNASEFNRIGLKIINKNNAVTIVGVLTKLSLKLQDDIPKKIGNDGRVFLKGELLDGFSNPVVLVNYPSGNVKKMELGDETQFNAQVLCNQKGEYNIEIFGKGQYGLSVLANFSIFKDTEPPVKLAYNEKVGDSAKSIENVQEELFKLINKERKKLGLNELEWSQKASEIAKSHSIDMLENNFIGHESPNSGTPLERLVKGGLRPLNIAENIGRGYLPFEIHQGFMTSPGHRENIINSDLTHVGIGVVDQNIGGETSYIVTELFASFPKKIDPVDAKNELFEKVNEIRKQKGLNPIQSEDNLQKAAENGVGMIFSQTSLSQDELIYKINKQLDPFSAIYSKAITALQVVTDLSKATPIDSIMDPGCRFIGIGIKQGDHPRYGTSIIVIVYTLAWPR